MADPTLTVTLAHPLSATQAGSLGLNAVSYRVETVLTIPVTVAMRLVYAGWTTINPQDRAAIDALLGNATPGAAADETTTTTFIGPTLPPNLPKRYAWWQTGLGADGAGVTLWIEDGT